MEIRFRRILLSCLLGLLVSPLWAQTRTSVIEPEPQRREISEANIDTENFEIGLTVGVISIEDFSTSMIAGLRLAYHINENFFVEAAYGQTEAGQTSFELLSGGAPLLTDKERNYRYYNLGLGYSLNGETFVTDSWVINSATYFVLGAGSTEFAGDEHFTLTLGAGYKVLLSDYFALRVEVNDHLFNSELIGAEKTTHNIHYGVGATFFF
jgi:outer membrane beta-barrel protein